LTENHLLAHEHQVLNDIRQARPAIRVSPVDSKADPETADVFRGMIRNIETLSRAEKIYDTAAENAIDTGYGWIRVGTRYADDNSFDQEAYIKRIRNPFSCMLGPHEEMDGSDAEYGFVFDDIDREVFKSKYKGKDPVSFDNDDLASSGWCSDKKVRIAEYFYKDYETKKIYLVDGQVLEELPEGFEADEERTVRVAKVRWCKISGKEILEKGEWIGKYIPIVPVYGEEKWHDGRRKSYSLIHQGKDPQRRFNYMLSAETEYTALQPKAPFIGVRGAFNSTRNKWLSANTQNHAFMEFDPVKLPDGQWATIAPQRQMPPMGSSALSQQIIFAAEGVKTTLGRYEQSLGQQGNETSGRAILARQAEGDNATFHFIDNLSVSISQVGRILIDIIPKVYSGERIVRIIGEDGTETNVPVNQPFMKDGDEVLPLKEGMPAQGIYDLNVGKYDIVCDVGPSYATKRQEAANSIIELSRANPKILEVAGDILMKNLDIPYADDIAKRLETLLPPELRGEDPQAQQLQLAMQAVQELQGQIGQMEQALKSKSENEQTKTMIEVEKLKLEAKKIEIDAMKMSIEAAKAEAEINQKIPAEAMNDIAAALADLDARTQDMGEAVNEILSAEEEKQAASESGGIMSRLFRR
jgi:hypothetical protein